LLWLRKHETTQYPLQSEATIQELSGSKSNLEKQLKEKTEELFHTYQQNADLSEEKKVLVDLIKQLCMESVKYID
jgi:methylphosphotriester-DNA--protein-cysteine methyltransferase